MDVSEIQKINIESAFEMSFVDLLRRRPYVAHLMMQLKKVQIKTGRTAIMFKDKRLALVYNPKFIQLMYAISPAALANYWIHEVSHIALMHPLIATGRRANEMALDIIANANALRLEIPKGQLGLIPCPVCTIKGPGQTIKAYLNRAAGISTKSWSGPMLGGWLNYRYSFNDENLGKINCRVCNNTAELSPTLANLTDDAVDRMNLTFSHFLGPIEKIINESEATLFAPVEDIYRELAFNYNKDDAKFLMEALFLPNPEDMFELSMVGKTAEERDEAEHAMKEAINKLRGKGLPQHWEDTLDDMCKKKDIPWDTYLSSRMCQAIETLKESCRLVRNRRFDFDHPGDKKIPKLNVVVGIDTSASMSKEMIKSIKDRVLALQGKINITCTIVEFDTQIRAVYKVDELSEKIYGRGGTDLTIPLQWMVTTKQPAGTISFVFTDGDGPINIDPSKVRGIDVHWMLTEGGTEDEVKRFKYKRSFIKRISI